MTEHALQAAIIAECNRRARQDPRWGRVFAVPNGGDRHGRVGAKLKREGVRRGVPDLFLLLALRGYHGLAMELKVGRNKPTVEQSDWLAWLTAQGYCCFVVHDSAEQALRAIEWYLDGDA